MFGSIVALPFVALVWIIKLPFAIVASGASAIGSVGMAIIKLPIAAVGAVWWAIVAVFGVLLRIPFRSIAKMLILSVALVWRIVASVFIMLGRVLSNPLGLALSIVILIVVLAAVYPEFSLGLTLALLILMAGAFWLSKLPSPFRIARNLALGEPITRVPPVLNTQDLDEIYALTPREFEWFVRDILTDLGYRNLSVVGGGRRPRSGHRRPGSDWAILRGAVQTILAKKSRWFTDGATFLGDEELSPQGRARTYRHDVRIHSTSNRGS